MYTILRVYADLSSIAEKADNMISIFNACAIYAEDPELKALKVWNTETGALIIDYYRGE